MKSHKLILILAAVGILLSFIYGVLTVQYKLFPFEYVSKINQALSSDTKRPSSNHSDYFYHKKSFFEQHGRYDYDVVFIGDSLTDGAEWQDLFPSLNIANRGIDADKTDGVLNRLDSIYSTSADRAFIMIGINDILWGKDIDVIFENYKTIVSNLSEHGMKVYIQSTLFVGKQRQGFNIKIAELNVRLQLLATQHELMTFVDLNAGLAQEGLLNAKYSRDDIHLNAGGYAVWKDIISHYIQ